MATSSHASDDNQTKTFKTFPEFSKLTLADRERYEELIKDYPPLAEIAFTNIMQWWDHLGSASIALFNGNLVISYWLPGDEKMSGLSLVGINKLDECICLIFDYLRERGEHPRLVHMPEFMIEHIEYPELFCFENERILDEYVVSLASFFPLQHMSPVRRGRVRKFLAKMDESDAVVRSLDLSEEASRQMLFDAVGQWPKDSTINRLSKLSKDAMSLSITEAAALGTENICLFIKGKLHAFMLYHQPHDKRYIILLQAKVSFAMPYIFDYTVYAWARHLCEQGVTFANLNVDLGAPMLRVVKLALGPQNFFRKYIVEPAGRTI